MNKSRHRMIQQHATEKKRKQEWLGAKVQLSETEDAGFPHIITDIAVTNSARTDYEALGAIQERLEMRNCYLINTM